jgi:hypothetical protein
VIFPKEKCVVTWSAGSKPRNDYIFFNFTLDAGRFFFKKKILKYCDDVLKYFTMFSQEKLQENKTYYPNISV